MARRNGRKVMSEINMVPFIDIMMVLLVAFMVSAPMLTRGLQVDLPKTDSKIIPLQEDVEALIVSVEADGQFFIDLGAEREQAKNLKDIATRVGKGDGGQSPHQSVDQGRPQSGLWLGLSN